MKCLFVHDFRSYKKNGKNYTTNLSYDILKKRYVDTFGELYILNRSGDLEANMNEDGLVEASGDGVYFVDKIGIFSPASFVKDYTSIKRKVIETVSKAEFVIIRLDSFLGLIAAEYCRKRKKKYLIEVAGCVWDSFWNKGVYGKLIAFPLLKKMQKEIYNAPYVVYVTRQFLQKRYPTKGQNTNVSNVQLKSLQEDILQRRLDKINEVSKNPKHVYNIVTVASVEVRYKGQETVIRALAKLKKNGSNNFHYHLIGGGNPTYLKEIVTSLGVENDVTFHGSMNHDKVMLFLNGCDIYVQPSKQEGLPRSLIEGMSRGMLCYGTKVAGIPELLEEKVLISTKGSNYKELTRLLNMVNGNLYAEQAKVNFNKAKKYEENILEARRKNFFEAFKSQKQFVQCD